MATTTRRSPRRRRRRAHTTASRLRWRLHELDPYLDPTSRSLDRASSYDKFERRLDPFDGNVARLHLTRIGTMRDLTYAINELEVELSSLITHLARPLLAIADCRPLTAAEASASGAARWERAANLLA